MVWTFETEPLPVSRIRRLRNAAGSDAAVPGSESICT